VAFGIHIHTLGSGLYLSCIDFLEELLVARNLPGDMPVKIAARLLSYARCDFFSPGFPFTGDVDKIGIEGIENAEAPAVCLILYREEVFFVACPAPCRPEQMG